MIALLRVHISESDHPERIVELTGTATIGRDSDNDIVLDEMTISRCHALLLLRPEGVSLIDLDSTNGTFVNDRSASSDEPVRLMDGDEIRLGRVVVRYHAAPAVGAADG